MLSFAAHWIRAKVGIDHEDRKSTNPSGLLRSIVQPKGSDHLLSNTGVPRPV